ncbi:MAG: hypothetical protein AAF711_10125, partial [Planctomycetota bacterium]
AVAEALDPTDIVRVTGVIQPPLLAGRQAEPVGPVVLGDLASVLADGQNEARRAIDPPDTVVPGRLRVQRDKDRRRIG